MPALGFHRARHRRAAHARRLAGGAAQRGPGRSRSGRDGLPGVDPIQPPALAAPGGFRPACADGADLPSVAPTWPLRRRTSARPCSRTFAGPGAPSGRRSGRRSRPRPGTSRRKACAAAWQPEVVALAAPLLFKGSRYALNVSLSTAEPLASAVRELAPTLLALSARIQHDLDVATDAW